MSELLFLVSLLKIYVCYITLTRWLSRRI